MLRFSVGGPSGRTTFQDLVEVATYGQKQGPAQVRLPQKVTFAPVLGAS